MPARTTGVWRRRAVPDARAQRVATATSTPMLSSGQGSSLESAEGVERLLRGDVRIDGADACRAVPPCDRALGVCLGERPRALDDDEPERQPAIDRSEEAPGRVGQDDDREERVEPAVEDLGEVRDDRDVRGREVAREPDEARQDRQRADAGCRVAGRR